MTFTSAPTFDVEFIDFNYTGTHVFVAGRHGISVILLPQTCGQLRNLDDGSEHVLARCVHSILYIDSTVMFDTSMWQAWWLYIHYKVIIDSRLCPGPSATFWWTGTNTALGCLDICGVGFRVRVLVLWWRTVKQKCIRLVCEKLAVFPYGQDIIGNVYSLAFWRCNQLQDRSGVYEKYAKM